MLAEAASKLKAGDGPSNALPAPIPVPSLSASTPADLRLKGVVEATAFEDEDTCSGLVLKRKKGFRCRCPIPIGLRGSYVLFPREPPECLFPS